MTSWPDGRRALRGEARGGAAPAARTGTGGARSGRGRAAGPGPRRATGEVTRGERADRQEKERSRECTRMAEIRCIRRTTKERPSFCAARPGPMNGASRLGPSGTPHLLTRSASAGQAYCAVQNASRRTARPRGRGKRPRDDARGPGPPEPRGQAPQAGRLRRPCAAASRSSPTTPTSPSPCASSAAAS